MQCCKTPLLFRLSLQELLGEEGMTTLLTCGAMSKPPGDVNGIDPDHLVSGRCQPSRARAAKTVRFAAPLQLGLQLGRGQHPPSLDPDHLVRRLHEC